MEEGKQSKGGDASLLRWNSQASRADGCKRPRTETRGLCCHIPVRSSPNDKATRYYTLRMGHPIWRPFCVMKTNSFSPGSTPRRIATA